VYTIEKHRNGLHIDCGQYEVIVKATDVFPLKKQSFDEISHLCHEINSKFDNEKKGQQMDINSYIQNLFNTLIFQYLFDELASRMPEKFTAKAEKVLFLLVFIIGFFYSMSPKLRPIGLWFWLYSVFFSVSLFWKNGPNVFGKDLTM
jgi:hypothetical protein